MNSYRKIVCKELKNQKLTSILIIIAIVLSTLMTTVIGQSIMAQLSRQKSKVFIMN